MRVDPVVTLEFNIVLARLAGLALSEGARAKLTALRPSLSERECRLRMQETTEAHKIIDFAGTPPLASMKGMAEIMELASKGAMLLPEQLTGVADFIRACRRMKSYLKKCEVLELPVAYYGASLCELAELFEEIDHAVRNGVVDSEASPALRDIRRKTENINSSIKAKLESLLRGKKEWFTDGYVTTRNGRFVLPVKREYKNQVSGAVIDTSATGGTYFIEPSSVRKLQEELASLQLDEENEIRKILYTLTVLVDEQATELKLNRECMETLDFAFAKARLALEMKAISVPVTAERHIKIVGGRHPMLKPECCVPLDFEIGGKVKGVVITGPNTGGKTVALKTVGLLSFMAQCGLHLPVLEGSTFAIHNGILCDIGDGQSITENLSTFSSHITCVIDILANVTEESLVLLDELGSGTDPAEGMGLAISILEELRRRGCLFVATTHYPEIKEFAARTEGLINARMEFDRESLSPLYKLRIGEAGESCAIYIAQRLGFPEHMLKRAYAEAYGGTLITGQAEATVATASQIKREAPKRTEPLRSESFNIGDSVTVYPQKEVGIVYRRANDRGELGIQIKGSKLMINHKRIKLLTPADKLYPEDYDFSIIFDSVANRKARHAMDKGHRPDLEIKLTGADL